MHYAIIFKILGILLMLFSMSLVTPVAISLYYKDGEYFAFLFAFLITFITGLFAWWPTHNVRQDLNTRDGFLITALFWIVLALFGSLPFMLSSETHMTLVNAVFESLSGLSTTGATVMTDLDSLPRSILFYRQQLQWLGGIGIVVIAVAILPMLGVGGMQLYRAETPGPVKDNKLTPRITETAKTLLFIYLGLTAACFAAYWLAGMDMFDAISHAFSTVAIGGFSTHDESIGYFKSDAIVIICTVFMFLSGVNFVLHFSAWQEKSLTSYLRDPEFRFYTTMVLIGVVIVVLYLGASGHSPWKESILNGTFVLVSILTTTGFGVTDFSQWPTFLPYLIFMFAFMGGCAGSTGGGIKMIRVFLMFKQGVRELHRLIHPNAVIPMKIGNSTVSDRVVEAVWGFVAVYAVAYMCMVVIVIATGLDFVTAFTAVGASINNLGPGLGEVAAHYGEINSAAKWILCIAMLLGRLEVFTLLVLFTPMFWRR